MSVLRTVEQQTVDVIGWFARYARACDLTVKPLLT